MRNIDRLTKGLLALALTFVVSGCQQGADQQATEPEPEPAGERIENPQGGVAIAALPSLFELEGRDGERIVLSLADPEIDGELVVTPGEKEIGGINLVAACEAHKQEILERPGGEYQGQRELGSHLGTAFYSRGRYLVSEDSEAVEEETVIFLVHPWGDRTLQLVYRYPAGDDSAERIQDHLFTLLGEIEALPVDGGAEDVS